MSPSFIIEETASRIAEDLPFIPLYTSPVFSAYRGLLWCCYWPIGVIGAMILAG